MRWIPDTMKKDHDQKSSLVLDSLIFLYVFSVIVLPSVPVLSRTSLIFTAAISFVLLVRYGTTGSLSISKWIALPLLFILYSFASVLWSASPSSALLSAFTLLSAVLGAIVVWIALLSGASWQAVVSSSFISGFTVILTTIPEMSTAGSNMRLAGILENPNAMAIHLTTSAFILLATEKKKWLYGISGFCFVLFATIFSGSIKMILFWVIFSCFILYRMYLWSKKSYLKTSLLMCIYFLMIAIPLFLGSLLVDNLEELTVTKRFYSLLAGENTSGTTRLAMLEEAISLWSQKPMVGNGIDQFRVLGSYGTYSHNNYAEMLADFGLIGTTLFYLFDLILLYYCFKGIFSVDRRYLLVFIITLISFLWDFGLVSYVEKSSWLLAVISFYLLHMAEKERSVRLTRGDYHV